MNYTELHGTIEEIIFVNDENGYTVCVIETLDEMVTAVGIMPYIGAGEEISVRGNWDIHPTFGRQFKVEYFEKSLPTSASSIYKYLASGAIKGIGPVTAERIVEEFGEETFEIIENNHMWLTNVKGITKAKAEKIHESYQEQFGMRAVMMFCGTYFGPSIAVKLYKKYGGAAVDVIKMDPYALVDDIFGISFMKADKVALDLNFDKKCDPRIRAGIKYVLQVSVYRDGNCYLPRNIVVNHSCLLLEIEEEAVEEVLNDMLFERHLSHAENNNVECIYLPELLAAEKYCAEKLLSLTRAPRLAAIENVEGHIEMLENIYDVNYDPKQRKAIKSSLTEGVTIVTGGPGTGKTTVIKAIISMFTSLGISFALCAPTGRAAKRMTESSGYDAKTIHRLLEMEYKNEGELKFTRDDSNPLPYSAIVVDEVSMVDVQLMAALLKATKLGTYLILIGDADQLPSVGAGDVLNDIIESGKFPTIRLTNIFRQAEESLIVRNAHAVNRGEMPKLSVKNNDFFFVESNSDKNIISYICELIKVRLPRAYSFDPFDDVQVISPSRKGSLGTKTLNQVLQSVLNPPDASKPEKKLSNITFRLNDKVMQIKNNYDIEWKRGEFNGFGVFNGDIGRIIAIDQKSETVKVDFDGKVVDYDFTILDELELAYSMTVHKSQGSEYPVVIIPLFESFPRLMTRNLLYTAITRAQKMVLILGKKSVVEMMVNNNQTTKRFSLLKDFILRL